MGPELILYGLLLWLVLGILGMFLDAMIDMGFNTKALRAMIEDGL